jgi:hypothetical protein
MKFFNSASKCVVCSPSNVATVSLQICCKDSQKFYCMCYVRRREFNSTFMQFEAIHNSVFAFLNIKPWRQNPYVVPTFVLCPHLTRDDTYIVKAQFYQMLLKRQVQMELSNRKKTLCKGLNTVNTTYTYCYSLILRQHDSINVVIFRPPKS